MALHELQCLLDPYSAPSQEMRPIMPTALNRGALTRGYFGCTEGFPPGVPGGGITGVL